MSSSRKPSKGLPPRAPSPAPEAGGSTMVSFVVTDDAGNPLMTSDGRPVTAVYSEVDPGIPEGSAEFRKQRRLADNRRSAAKSRARAEHEAQCRAERITVLEEENSKLRALLEGGGIAPPPSGGAPSKGSGSGAGSGSGSSGSGSGSGAQHQHLPPSSRPESHHDDASSLASSMDDTVGGLRDDLSALGIDSQAAPPPSSSSSTTSKRRRMTDRPAAAAPSSSSSSSSQNPRRVDPTRRLNAAKPAHSTSSLAMVFALLLTLLAGRSRAPVAPGPGGSATGAGGCTGAGAGGGSGGGGGGSGGGAAPGSSYPSYHWNTGTSSSYSSFSRHYSSSGTYSQSHHASSPHSTYPPFSSFSSFPYPSLAELEEEEARANGLPPSAFSSSFSSSSSSSSSPFSFTAPSYITSSGEEAFSLAFPACSSGGSGFDTALEVPGMGLGQGGMGEIAPPSLPALPSLPWALDPENAENGRGVVFFKAGGNSPPRGPSPSTSSSFSPPVSPRPSFFGPGVGAGGRGGSTGSGSGSGSGSGGERGWEGGGNGEWKNEGKWRLPPPPPPPPGSGGWDRASPIFDDAKVEEVPTSAYTGRLSPLSDLEDEDDDEEEKKGKKVKEEEEEEEEERMEGRRGGGGGGAIIRVPHPSLALFRPTPTFSLPLFSAPAPTRQQQQQQQGLQTLQAPPPPLPPSLARAAALKGQSWDASNLASALAAFPDVLKDLGFVQVDKSKLDEAIRGTKGSTALAAAAMASLIMVSRRQEGGDAGAEEEEEVHKELQRQLGEEAL